MLFLACAVAMRNLGWNAGIPRTGNNEVFVIYPTGLEEGKKAIRKREERGKKERRGALIWSGGEDRGVCIHLSLSLYLSPSLSLSLSMSLYLSITLRLR